MSIDYNASLIAALYNADSSKKAVDISNEMTDIKDPIFPKQIYEAYKRFKTDHYSHYFVSDLVRFQSKEASDILKEIAKSTHSTSDIIMMIDHFAEIEYFEPMVVRKVGAILVDALNDDEDSEYEIEKYFAYLVKSGADISEIQQSLENYFMNDEKTTSSRKTALKSLLKSDPKRYVGHYDDIYESLIGKKSEIIFADVISLWHGGRIDSIHSKILRLGSSRAKEVIEQRIKKEKEKGSEVVRKEQEKIKEEYSSADVIREIAELRLKINNVTLADERFGFKVLESYEEFYKQNLPPNDKEGLVGYCIDLRTFAQAFTRDVVGFDIEMDLDEAKKNIPGISDLTGSINKFHLMLLKKNIPVDQNLYGLRSVTRICSRIAHPVNADDTIELLTKEGLVKKYCEEEWSLLHREILIKYRDALAGLVSVIISSGHSD